MKRLLPWALAAGVVLAISYYAYNVGPVGVVNGILATLLLLRLFGRPNRPVRADGGAGTVPVLLGSSRREESRTRREPRFREWSSQGRVRGGVAMLVTRQISGEGTS